LWFMGAVVGAVLGTGAARAAPKGTLHLVPAQDAALAVTVLAARGTAEPVVLVDPRDRTALGDFQSSWGGPVRCFRLPQTGHAVSEAMQAAAREPCTTVDDLIGFSRTLWPEARVAIATAVGTAAEDDHEWLLRAAAFAGVIQAALLPLPADTRPTKEALQAWDLDVLYLTPSVTSWDAAARAISRTVVDIPTPDSLVSELSRVRTAAPSTVVIANPKDRESIFSPSSLSLLAPLVSAVRGAPLILTALRDPEVVESHVLEFLDRHRISPSHIILVGDELALRSHRVADPVLAAGGPEARGGGSEVRVELFSGVPGGAPQDFVVGRIVAESASQGSVVLARQYHSSRETRDRPVVFFANADGMFRLGETISRTTAAALRNVGVPVQAYYGSEVTDTLIQRTLAETDMLVWEGHARDLTLEESGTITASAAPEIVVLQGCHTFDRSDPFILMDKGTIAAVGTSTAVYSAPGSAFAQALFDALLYEGTDLGTAARDARNFVLALSQLQRARGHRDWPKTLRAALAFGLWGDPMIRPRLRPRRPTSPPVRWKLGEDALSLTIPAGKLNSVRVGPYRAESPPRVMLSGLLLRDRTSGDRVLKDLYFTVQRLPAPFTTVCSPGKGWNTISLYAPRSGTVSFLARPDWRKLGRSPSAGPFVFPLAKDSESCRPSPSRVRKSRR